MKLDTDRGSRTGSHLFGVNPLAYRHRKGGASQPIESVKSVTKTEQCAQTSRMKSFTPININDPFCEVYAAIPDKFVVDLVNSLDVARDHSRAQAKRSGLMDRLMDGIDGSDTRRQRAINGALTDSMEASLIWLGVLTEQVTLGHRALSQVATAMARLTTDVAEATNFSVDTRNRLDDLDARVGSQLSMLEKRFNLSELKENAHIKIGLVFDRWRAGKFNVLPPAARFYAALEELRWGAVGMYLGHTDADTAVCDHFREMITHRATTQIRADLELKSIPGRLDWSVWHRPLADDTLEGQVLRFYGDWTDSRNSPISYTIAMSPPTLPKSLPLLLSPESLSERLLAEVLPEERS